MKPQLLKVSKDLVHSFSARHDATPDINNRWHYHPEIEIIFFKQGHGTQFIGDNVSPFLSGDVILVGANLPHYWQFNNAYFDTDSSLSADVSVVHFTQDFWGETFINLPENVRLKNTLEQAKRGIKISGAYGNAIGAMLTQIIDAQGANKLILLLQVLEAIASCPEQNMLASLGFRHNFQEAEKDRIHAIYNYAIANFRKKISLEEISAVANVSPNTFCKYFKSRSRKTFTVFINEIRVGHACKLLIENHLPIKEICYESGFYNFSSFHQYFKQITGKSPLTYQKSFVTA